LHGVPEWTGVRAQRLEKRPKSEKCPSRMGKGELEFGGVLAWRIKYRYDNRT
jgi:hypothetical protein